MRQLLTYDARHRRLSLFSEERGALQLRYDRRGRIRSFSHNGEGERGWDYDDRGRLIKSSRSGGHDAFRHDRHGNLTTYTDANGVEWTMEYGAFDLPVVRTDGEGHRWQYRYDKDTLTLCAVINPAGESWRYTLDGAGRVVSEEDYAGARRHYVRDEDGHSTERRGAAGQVTRYEYDACGRLITLRAPEGVTRYVYDRVGRLLSVSAPDDGLQV